MSQDSDARAEQLALLYSTTEALQRQTLEILLQAQNALLHARHLAAEGQAELDAGNVSELLRTGMLVRRLTWEAQDLLVEAHQALRLLRATAPLTAAGNRNASKARADPPPPPADAGTVDTHKCPPGPSPPDVR